MRDIRELFAGYFLRRAAVEQKLSALEFLVESPMRKTEIHIFWAACGLRSPRHISHTVGMRCVVSRELTTVCRETKTI